MEMFFGFEDFERPYGQQQQQPRSFGQQQQQQQQLEMVFEDFGRQDEQELQQQQQYAFGGQQHQRQYGGAAQQQQQQQRRRQHQQNPGGTGCARITGHGWYQPESPPPPGASMGGFYTCGRCGARGAEVAICFGPNSACDGFLAYGQRARQCTAQPTIVYAPNHRYVSQVGTAAPQLPQVEPVVPGSVTRRDSVMSGGNELRQQQQQQQQYGGAAQQQQRQLGVGPQQQQQIQDVRLGLDVISKRGARRAAAREELWNMFHGPQPRTVLQKKSWWERLQSAKRRAGGVGVPYRSFDELGVAEEKEHVYAEAEVMKLGVAEPEVEELRDARAPLAASVQQQHEAEVAELSVAEPEVELGFAEAEVAELGVAEPVVELGFTEAEVVELGAAEPEGELGGVGVTPPPLSSFVKPQQLRGHEGVSMQQQWDGDGVGGGVPQIGLCQSGSYPFEPRKPKKRDGVVW